jgi:DNA-directed RNA polymerases I, II, and III subunit RPABC1
MDAAIESFHNLDLNRFYKIYRTVHEMLKDRNYVAKKEMLSKDDWISMFIGYLAELDDTENDLDVFGIIDNLTLLFTKGKKTLLVYFHPLDSKLAQTDMNYIHALMAEKSAQQLIIVASSKATPKVSNVLGILGNNAQIFSENELVINVTKHQLVPKHSQCLKEEREHILDNYTILADGKRHLELIPGIFTNDPIVRYYNWKVDDLIRIERPRKDGFVDLTYRIVTHPMTEKDCH